MFVKNWNEIIFKQIKIIFENIPLVTEDLKYYIDQKSIPGGTLRNWDSYGHKVAGVNNYTKAILADPQTSGGLLVAVDSSGKDSIESILKEFSLEGYLLPIGRFTQKQEFIVSVK